MALPTAPLPRPPQPIRARRIVLFSPAWTRGIPTLSRADPAAAAPVHRKNSRREVPCLSDGGDGCSCDMVVLSPVWIGSNSLTSAGKVAKPEQIHCRQPDRRVSTYRFVDVLVDARGVRHPAGGLILGQVPEAIFSRAMGRGARGQSVSGVPHDAIGAASHEGPALPATTSVAQPSTSTEAGRRSNPFVFDTRRVR